MTAISTNNGCEYRVRNPEIQAPPGRSEICLERRLHAWRRSAAWLGRGEGGKRLCPRATSR
jgi:hypothetical protein